MNIKMPMFFLYDVNEDSSYVFDTGNNRWTIPKKNHTRMIITEVDEKWVVYSNSYGRFPPSVEDKNDTGVLFSIPLYQHKYLVEIFDLELLIDSKGRVKHNPPSQKLLFDYYSMVTLLVMNKGVVIPHYDFEKSR
jgi:hypothetical protein